MAKADYSTTEKRCILIAAFPDAYLTFLQLDTTTCGTDIKGFGDVLQDWEVITTLPVIALASNTYNSRGLSYIRTAVHGQTTSDIFLPPEYPHWDQTLPDIPVRERFPSSYCSDAWAW